MERKEIHAFRIWIPYLEEGFLEVKIRVSYCKIRIPDFKILIRDPHFPIERTTRPSLVPVRCLSRPSRSMHFGELSETKKLARTTSPELHRPRAIKRARD